MTLVWYAAIMSKVREPDEGTRQALIRAALDLFGRQGFEASSIRQIAQLAGVNSAGIAYHFGGKAGLREACAGVIVATMKQRVLGPAVLTVEPASLSPDAALDTILAIVDRATAFMTRALESEMIARFVLREIIEPSSAFEALYEGAFGPVHGRLCMLWAAAAGTEPDARETKLAVFAMVGQVLYFRLARPIVMRRMGWETIAEDEEKAIAAIIRASVRATLLSARGDRS